VVLRFMCQGCARKVTPMSTCYILLLCFTDWWRERRWKSKVATFV